MSQRELALAASLIVATALVSYGVWLIYRPAAWIVGGALQAVLAALFLLEAD